MALDVLINWTDREGMTDSAAGNLRHRVQDELEWACLGVNVKVMVPGGGEVLRPPLKKKFPAPNAAV